MINTEGVEDQGMKTFLYVEEILFNDGRSIHNRSVCIFNGFLIVDEELTWYILSQIRELRGVVKPKQKISF